LKSGYVQFALLNWGLNPYIAAARAATPLRGGTLYVSVPVPALSVQPSVADGYDISLPYYSPQTDIHTVQNNAYMVSPGVAVLEEPANAGSFPPFVAQSGGTRCAQSESPLPLSDAGTAYLTCPQVTTLCSNASLAVSPVKGYVIRSLTLSGTPQRSVQYKVTNLGAVTVHLAVAAPTLTPTAAPSKTAADKDTAGGVNPAVFAAVVAVLPIGYGAYALTPIVPHPLMYMHIFV
jgi:hypothetical protein